MGDQGPGHAPPNDGGGGGVGAVQFELEPPPLPVQFQVHGPAPTTVDAVPVAHKPETGADAVGVLFDGPHDPLTMACEEHDAAVPPFTPEQLHA